MFLWNDLARRAGRNRNMNSLYCPKQRSQRHIFIGGVAALCLAAVPVLRGSTKTYVGPDNGDYGTAGNWSPSGVPASGDNVVLGTHSAGSSNLHVSLTNNQKVSSLTLDSSGISGSMIFSQIDTNFEADTVNVGLSHSGNTFNQIGGNNTVNTLNIGSGASTNNAYNLSYTSTLTTAVLNVGAVGVGAFNQSSGDLKPTTQSTTPGIINVGTTLNSSGTYNLSGGRITPTEISYYLNPFPGSVDLNIGGQGTGVFNQSGGTMAATSVTVGGSAIGTGTYNLSGGMMGGDYPSSDGGAYTVQPMVDVSTHGTFNLLTGGTFSGQLTLDGGGTFNVSGGTFDPSSFLTINGGTMHLNGHDLNPPNLTGINGVIDSGSNTSRTTTLTITPTGYNSDVPEVFGTRLQDGSASSRLAVTFAAGGVIQLTGANTYSGPTTVNGKLQAGGNNTFSPNSAVTVSGGILDANIYTNTIASLFGTSGSVSVAGPGSLTVGTDNSSSNLGLLLTGGGILAKAGNGTLTLAGGGNFYGTLLAQGGTLAISSSSGLAPSVAANLTGSGATLSVTTILSLGTVSGVSGSTINLADGVTLTVGSGGTDSTLASGFSGTGALVKVGLGNLTLGSGDNYPNTDAALSIYANEGTLTLNRADGVNAVAASLRVAGATVTLAHDEQIADDASLILNSGTFDLNGHAETVGGITGAGGTIVVGSGTFNVIQPGADTFGGNVTGTGKFNKSGPGDLTLGSASGYTGSFTASAGRLILQGDVGSTNLAAKSGGVIRLNGSTVNLGSGTIQAATGGSIEYYGATVNNGYLRGSGSQTIVRGGNPSVFNAVTTYNSTVIAQNGPATFNNFTNGGTLNNAAALTIDGGVNSYGGILNISGNVSTQDFSSGGVITINPFGTLSNSGSSLVAGGGSRTTINAGGTLSTSADATIELNGALLVNDGTQTGVLNVNYGSTAKGSGAFGMVNVNDGGRFGANASTSGAVANGSATNRLAGAHDLARTDSIGPRLQTAPATANVGNLTLGSGSLLTVNVQDARGAAGSGYDTAQVQGALTLGAYSMAGDQITVALSSLGGNGTAGAAANFDPSQSYGFVLATAGGGITGFAASMFTVDTSGFQNSLGGSHFFVALDGNNLDLDFTPVPEPATWLGGALLLGLAGSRAWRRRVPTA